MKKNILCTIACCASLLGAPTFADDTPKPPASPLGSDLLPAPKWGELTPQQKDALSPLARQFDSLPAQQRRKWKALADRAPSWPDEKKLMIQSRMLMWANMSPEQRASARQQAMAAKNMPQNGTRVESWLKWQDLPEEDKETLHGKALTPPGVPVIKKP